MKKAVCFALLLLTVCACFAGCGARRPIRERAKTCVTFYSEPRAEEEVLGTHAAFYDGRCIEWRNVILLQKYVNSIRNWTDDNAADRLPFEFIGEFKVKNNEKDFFFTEDGIIYYDHYYGKLSDEGREFLMSLKPGDQ